MIISKYQVCFIGNAIVDIISKITDEKLDELKIPKGSMQLVDEKSSNKILDHIKNQIIKVCGLTILQMVGRKADSLFRSKLMKSSITKIIQMQDFMMEVLKSILLNMDIKKEDCHICLP